MQGLRVKVGGFSVAMQSSVLGLDAVKQAFRKSLLLCSRSYSQPHKVGNRIKVK